MYSGSKALSNVTEQFSKLNRIGQNLNAKSKFLTKPKFTIGKSPDKSNTSSESEDDYDVSLYQPRPNNTQLKREIQDQPKLTFTDSSAPTDAFLPSVGIVMRTQNDSNITLLTEGQNILENKENMCFNEATSHMNDVRLSSIMQNVTIQKGTNFDRSVSPTPEIRISESGKVHPPSSLNLDRKLSHSSGEVDNNEAENAHSATDFVQDMILSVDNKFSTKQRSSSEQDIVMNLSSSQSESALKHIKSGFNNLTSPVASATKDLVLSPFSKFAKGMQNLGANLDPRKISKGVAVKQVTERELEEQIKLRENWKNCKTKLIAL